MYTFEYKRASSLQEASQLLNGDAKFLAGGQTLLATIKQRLSNPSQLIDLQDIKELTGIKKDGNVYKIGAMTRHMDVANHSGIIQDIPGLAKLAGGIGDKQVRRMGTIGGSLANNDPSACYPSAVLALNAKIVTNQRTLSAEDYFQGMFTTALNENEIILEVHFPITSQCAYAKFAQPASRYALVGVFVAKHSDGVRVAITGSSRGVFRHTELEAALQKNFAKDSVSGVAVDSNDFSDDIHASAAYKASLVIAQTQRAVQAALA